MSEALLSSRGSSPEQDPDMDLALFESIFGEDLSVDFTALSTHDRYDERHQIAQDAKKVAHAVRDNTLVVAKRLGITITDEEFAQWQPSEAELVKIRHDLSRQRKTLGILRSADEYLEDVAEAARMQGVSLRAHQKAVIDSFQQFLSGAERTEGGIGKSGIIEMPTGTGKTAIFSNIAAMVKHHEEATDPVRVLVLTPTQKILDQTVGRDGVRGFGKFAPHLDVGAFYQDEKDLDHDVVVMCTPSFNELKRQGKLPDYDVVIVDEAHTAIGDTTADNLREFCADKLMIGLTATPEYNEEKNVYQLFDHEIHQMELPDAIKGGLLAPVRAWMKQADPKIDTNTLPEDATEQRTAIRDAYRKARELAAVELIKEELKRGVGVVVKCPPGEDINYARMYAKMLNELAMADERVGKSIGIRRIKAGYVGGTQQKKEDRFALLEFYDQKKIDVLTYVKAIGMGWDSAHAKVFINLAPTTSRVEMVQALGRVLRLSWEDKKPVEAHIYDFVDPELGDRQYTPLMALNVEQGQLLTQEESEDVVIPKPRKEQERHPQVEVADFTVIDVGSMAIENEVEVIFPEDAGNTSVNHAEAVRILGISPPTYKQILMNLGNDPAAETITYNDLSAILELYPELNAKPLPKDGYIEVAEIANYMPDVPTFSLMRFSRERGIHPSRFKAADGSVRFYFEEASARRLISMAASVDYNLFEA